MSLAILTSPEAVQAAISEFDKIGRDRFLQKYGYGNGEILLRLDDGKSYDAEAILAAAVGYQHPRRGPLRPSEFVSSRAAIGDKLDELGFHVVDPYTGDHPTIRQTDIDLIASARQKAAQGLKYADLAQEERDAYSRVHDALAKLGEIAADELGQPDDLVVKLTSGFSPRSGVRGYLPKDLWFAVFPAENEDDLAGNPQIFMIVSERGVEYGFGAAVHPSDFSTQSLKDKVRETAPKIFERLPGARSQEAERISRTIEQSGKWFFRRKHRLEPNVSDFPTLNDLLAFLQSPPGAANSAGGISRYLHGAALDDADLVEEVKNTAHLFEPLLLRDWHDDHGNAPLLTQPTNHIAMAQTSEFSRLLDRFLRVFGAKRTGAFGIDTELREAIDGIQTWLQSCDPVRKRPEINVVISVGKGNWTNTPWIALLDRRVTKTTQSGIYLVFLIAEDLSITYLTLNQGMTALVQSLGQKAAAHEMVRIAADARSKVRQLGPSEFQLDNNIDLRSRSSASKNYEVGTIAHSDLPAGHVPDDRQMIDRLEWILNAYHHVTDIDEEQPSPDVTETDVAKEKMPAPPYSIDDAVADLFVSREHVEKTIGIWRRKMNLILQGAPGVGKSYLAKRLSYALIGARDDELIESVQFHQSYSYEDFIRGFRPDGNGGFELHDGIFLRFIRSAETKPASPHVMIIDEINRGNLSKIFGELMLLIEADKRSPEWATRLAYTLKGEGRRFIPDNVYLIGMMNTADRSLSFVDYALRRRFAFSNVAPQFDAPRFATFLSSKGVPEPIIDRVRSRMGELNSAIASDKVNLGPGFQIGHSFFTPYEPVEDAEAWYDDIIETEIAPLLEEYWFDNPERAEEWFTRLKG
ncbi:MrcB family domain-containing protein [Rhizobium leguminosarum]